MAFEFLFYCKTPIPTYPRAPHPSTGTDVHLGFCYITMYKMCSAPTICSAGCDGRFSAGTYTGGQSFQAIMSLRPGSPRSPRVTLVRGPFTRQHIPALLSIDCYQIPAGLSGSACSRLLLSPSAESQDHAAPIAHGGGKGKNRRCYIQSNLAVVEMENGRVFILH